MLAEERETQFCRLRNEIKSRLDYLRTELPGANGRTDEIRIEINSLEIKLSRTYNDFIKGSGSLFLATKEVKRFSIENRLNDNIEIKDYDSLFSNALNVLFRCVNKYDCEIGRFSTIFVLAIRRDFLNTIRQLSKRKRYSLREEDYSSLLEDESLSDPLLKFQKREEIERLNKGLRILTDKEREFLIRKYELEDSEYCKPRHSTGQNAIAKLKTYFESFENREVA